MKIMMKIIILNKIQPIADTKFLFTSHTITLKDYTCILYDRAKTLCCKMAQTKAQRSAAAKKAARTRKRNAAAKKGSKSRRR